MLRASPSALAAREGTLPAALLGGCFTRAVEVRWRSERSGHGYVGPVAVVAILEGARPLHGALLCVGKVELVFTIVHDERMEVEVKVGGGQDSRVM